ncbi:hypothetical protein J6590_092901, partial [Homalodisca vitripennis]
MDDFNINAMDNKYQTAQKCLNQSSPGPGRRCEVLIAGTNDNYINRHLEGFIAARQADAKFDVTILSHRYHLDPDLPVRDETTLANSCIEELATRYARVLNLGAISRKFFTRHGLTSDNLRGKRLLTGMIVRVASDSPLKTAGTSDMAIPTVTSSPTISQETAAVTPQHQCSRRLQPISYAGGVRKYPVLDCADKSRYAAAA